MKKRYLKKMTKLLSFCLVLLLIGTYAQDVSAATKYEKRAAKILKNMTMKEKIAQMFVVALPGSNAVAVQKQYQFGGYFFYRSDFAARTPSSMKTLLKSIQKQSRVKMLFAVDEEGGTVNRVSSVRSYRSKAFDSPRTVYNQGGYTAIKNDAAVKAKFLKSFGVNTNFSPVADTPYRTTDFMYKRSFSTNAQSVARFVRIVVGQMKQNNVVSTLKHFPGYGGNGDTHTLIVRDTRSLQTFKTRDLKPFEAGIKAGCDMIMISHNIVDCFDKTMPASLSKKVHRYLRKTMKFKGVMISDELSMAGASKYVGNSTQAAVKAIEAGNDMIITANYKTQFDAVYKAVKSGKISKSQINASVKRILIMKLKRGIIK